MGDQYLVFTGAHSHVCSDRLGSLAIVSLPATFWDTSLVPEGYGTIHKAQLVHAQCEAGCEATRSHSWIPLVKMPALGT